MVEAITASKLFPALMIFALVAPPAAVTGACILFARRRNRVGPKGGVSGIAFALAIVACGVVGGYLGMVLGVAQACLRAGNLCGLWGVLVNGPLASAAAILLAAVAVTARRPASKADDA